MTIEDYWNLAAPPALPAIPLEERQRFFEGAPAGTVIRSYPANHPLGAGWTEYHRRLEDGNWRHLDELTTVGPAYLTYETWDTSSPAVFYSYAGSSEYTIFEVVELPEGTFGG